jgi:hypothetical protein
MVTFSPAGIVRLSRHAGNVLAGSDAQASTIVAPLSRMKAVASSSSAWRWTLSRARHRCFAYLFAVRRRLLPGAPTHRPARLDDRPPSNL